MIWHRGAILPDDGLAIPIADRAFEHGLGLFETIRARGRRSPLLEAHRARMLRSAQGLGLAIRPEDWPTDRDVDRYLDIDGGSGDRILRITATGGTETGPSVVWMGSRPLPSQPTSIIARFGDWTVTRDDPMARHKALNYWSRKLAHEQARSAGADEALSLADGRIWEGSRTNFFAVTENWIATPSTLGPIVPGVLRACLLEIAPEIKEVDGFEPGRLGEAGEVFLTNAVRGIIPVARVVDRSGTALFEGPAPGPRTARLQSLLEARLGGFCR